ncbi:MAG TPA: O-antigen ligase family protein [Candidatus Tyrphobacter sp.]
MHYQPVVNQIHLPVPLDPLWTMIFAVVLVLAAMAVVKRAAYGIAALILVQPFALSHDIFATTVTLPKVTLIGILLGLWVRSGRRSALGERPIRNVLIALAMLVCAIAATAIVAAHRGSTLRETLKWLEYLVLFAATCTAYRRDPDDALLVRCWTLVAIAVAALALLQEAIGAPSGLVLNGEVIPRIAGPLEGPNQLGAYLAISLATLCAWCGRERLVGFAIPLACCALALTFSRGGIAGAVIAVAIVFAASPRTRSLLVRPLALGTALGVALVGLWNGITHAGLMPPPSSPSYAGGVGYRLELWRAAIELWRRHPLLGVGAGNYELDLPQVGLLGVRTHANSWYLQALAEGGIVLFSATIWLIATIVSALTRRLREASPWQVAALAATLGLAFHQIFDYLVFYPKVGATWWILVALGVAAMTRAAPANESGGRSAAAAGDVPRIS